MDTNKAHRVIAASVTLVFLVGIANSVFKTGKLPSFRFFVGVGVVYLILSAMAEKEPEIAQAFSIAILTGAVLSPEGEKGWLSYFQSGKEELAAPKKGQAASVSRREPDAGISVPGVLAPGRRLYAVSPELSPVASTLPPIAGILPSAFDKRREHHHSKDCDCHG